MKQLFKNIITYLLKLEARLVLRRFKPKVVTITGSVGKTATKDAVYASLASRYFVRKSEKSFNTEIGVPLTILGLPNAWSNPSLWIHNLLKGLSVALFAKKYPQWLVLEVGADRPGDIGRVARWVESDIVILTRLPKVPVHVEFFSSVEDVVNEKAKLISSLKPDGTLIINGDDEDIIRIAERSGRSGVTFGFSSHAAVRAIYPRIIYRKVSGVNVPAGITFKVDLNGNSVPITIHGALGVQHIYPALAAVIAGAAADLNMVEMAAALSDHESPRGRMRLIDGVKDSIIIDDTYNSSPIALSEALLALKKVKTSKKRIAVIGDMLELGNFSTGEHKAAGRLAAEVCDILITVGVRARFLAEGALIGGMHESNIFQYESVKNAGDKLQHVLGRGDIALVKGSQSMRMERVVEEVMAHPERKKELLVRQEVEWLRRG